MSVNNLISFSFHKLLIFCCLTIHSPSWAKTNTDIEPHQSEISDLSTISNKTTCDINKKTTLVNINIEETDKNNPDKKFIWREREVIMALALFVSFLSLWLTIRNQKLATRHRDEDKVLKEIEDFWFKEIITPKVVQPILNFQDKQLANVQNLNVKTMDDNERNKTIETFQNDHTALTFSINTLASVPVGEQFSKSLKLTHLQLEDSLQLWLYQESNKITFTNDEQNQSEPEEMPPENIQAVFLKARMETIRLISDFRDELKTNRINQHT